MAYLGIENVMPLGHPWHIYADFISSFLITSFLGSAAIH